VSDSRHCSAPFGAAVEAIRLARKCLPRTLRQLEGCELPAATALAIFKKEAFKRAEQSNLLVAQSLTGSGQKINALLSSDEPRPIDDIVETTGLNSSDVLATLCDMGMKGFARQLPGKQFSKILL